ncbi:hypothetical protein F4808DRAFT_459995, partial [Astrocystis sublimbata]
MFGGGSNSPAAKSDTAQAPEPNTRPDPAPADPKPSDPPTDGLSKSPDQVASGEKRSGNGSPSGRQHADVGAADKKRRSSGVTSKASNFIASARNSLNFQSGRQSSDSSARTPLQKLGKQDQALAVPQGQHNNSAGESLPGP